MQKNLTMTEKYQLPERWKWVKLGDIFNLQQGIAMSPQRRLYNFPYPFLRTSNVFWGRVDLSILDKMDFTDKEVDNFSLKPGDLLVCEGGEVGRTAIWRGEVETCLYQNHIHRLRKLNDHIVPEFYMYWLQCAFKVFQIYSGQESNTTIPNLSGTRLKSCMVPLPPIEEQKLIVTKIQELMQEAERAKTACEKQTEAINVLPQAILRRAFRGEL